MLSGSGVAPTLTADPPVSKQGRVFVLTGAGFAPNSQVSFASATGPVEVPTDSTGGFSYDYVVFAHSETGELSITAQSTGTPIAATATVLIQATTGQPPF
jgi:hypothetical protein